MAAISFKCPNCDGELAFDPSTRKYKCAYCASLFSREELDSMLREAASQGAGGSGSPGASPGAQGGADSSQRGGGAGASQGDADFRQKGGEPGAPDGGSSDGSAPNGGAPESGALLQFTCPSCGASILADETTAATHCYYCHNPIVLEGRLEGEYLPDSIIPFRVTREEAERRFLEEVGKKKFVPRGFFSRGQIENMSGVYFPYWVCDAKIEGRVEARAKKINVWQSGGVEYTKTTNYFIRREGDVTLDSMAESALQKANADLQRGLLPYDFEEAEPFYIGYLSGFQAERRDVEREQVQGIVREKMRSCAKTLLMDSISGYDSVQESGESFNTKSEKWSYALLPAWTITSRGRDGKIYHYSMNGQNGSVCGDLPLDRAKLLLCSAAGGIAAAALLLAIAALLYAQITGAEALVALAVGLASGWAIYYFTARRYRVENQDKAYALYQNGSVSFRAMDDMYNGEFTTRRDLRAQGRGGPR